MPTALAQPVLTLAVNNLQKLKSINEEDISTIWAVFSRCKDNLENGRRLENLSWRLWYRSCYGTSPNDNQLPPSLPFLPLNPTTTATANTVPTQCATASCHLKGAPIGVSPSSFNKIISSLQPAEMEALKKVVDRGLAAAANNEKSQSEAPLATVTNTMDQKTANLVERASLSATKVNSAHPYQRPASQQRSAQLSSSQPTRPLPQQPQTQPQQQQTQPSLTVQQALRIRQYQLYQQQLMAQQQLQQQMQVQIQLQIQQQQQALLKQQLMQQQQQATNPEPLEEERRAKFFISSAHSSVDTAASVNNHSATCTQKPPSIPTNKKLVSPPPPSFSDDATDVDDSDYTDSEDDYTSESDSESYDDEEDEWLSSPGSSVSSVPVPAGQNGRTRAPPKTSSMFAKVKPPSTTTDSTSTSKPVPATKPSLLSAALRSKSKENVSGVARYGEGGERDCIRTELTESLRQNIMFDRQMPFNTLLHRGMGVASERGCRRGSSRSQNIEFSMSDGIW
ncbi:hypothetical protein HK102_004800 [Quaeritorhiza haematococci]|nr:hypothetical protein HK102_004800 [Quaeritorhiza haematococci]